MRPQLDVWQISPTRSSTRQTIATVSKCGWDSWDVFPVEPPLIAIIYENLVFVFRCTNPSTPHISNSQGIVFLACVAAQFPFGLFLNFSNIQLCSGYTLCNALEGDPL